MDFINFVVQIGFEIVKFLMVLIQYSFNLALYIGINGEVLKGSAFMFMVVSVYHIFCKLYIKNIKVQNYGDTFKMVWNFRIGRFIRKFFIVGWLFWFLVTFFTFPWFYMVWEVRMAFKQFSRYMVDEERIINP